MEIRDKAKEILENDSSLAGIKKIYKGMPPSVTIYPSIVLAYDTDDITQSHQSNHGKKHNIILDVIVMDKYLNYADRQDKLLEWTWKIYCSLTKNRTLDGLKDAGGDWRVIDTMLPKIDFETLSKPREFVLDGSVIKATIITEGL